MLGGGGVDGGLGEWTGLIGQGGDQGAEDVEEGGEPRRSWKGGWTCVGASSTRELSQGN